MRKEEKIKIGLVLLMVDPAEQGCQKTSFLSIKKNSQKGKKRDGWNTPEKTLGVTNSRADRGSKKFGKGARAFNQSGPPRF